MIDVLIGCHIVAFLIGFVLDIILGDPLGFIHPVILIGKLINILDKALYTGEDKRDFKRGILLCVTVVASTCIVTGVILIFAYKIQLYLGVIIESLLTWSILATKSLKTESMKVYRALLDDDIEKSRFAVSMIVGRDTKSLDEEGIVKATVETVAENTSDGIIAPMIYTALGGPILGYFYKSINTMDSMIGYKNDRYMYLGRAAARLDDVVNFFPARIAAGIMIISAFFGGSTFDARSAYDIYKRDSNKSKSPNAAKCESVCAGAMGIQLLGDAYYFGKLVKKDSIGDKKRPVCAEDIKLVNRLMYMTSFLCEGILVAVLLVIFVILGN